MKKNYMNWKASAILVTMILLSTVITTASAQIIPGESKLVKIQQSGYGYSILWSRTWTDGDYMNTTGGKVTTDSNNNVITYVDSGATEEKKILKYNSNGAFIREIIIDIDGAENITEMQSDAQGSQAPLEGQQQIPMSIQRQTATTSEFWVNSIMTDSQDNIIIVIDHLVRFENPQLNVINVFKYDPNGNELWKNAYSYTDFLTLGMDSVIDSNGNIYVPCITLIGNAFLMKLSSDGNVAWFKSIKTTPLWFALSTALDSNQNPVVSTLNCLVGPNSTTVPIGFTKFNKLTGIKMADSIHALPLESLWIHDAALAVDPNDNTVYFGFLGLVHKVSANLQNIIWTKQYPYYINDLKADGSKLIACGGWCTVGETMNYYASIINKATGATMLHMALGALLYCEDWFFQGFNNQLQGMSIDTQGNVLFAGGEGGQKIVKVKITSGIGMVPNPNASTGTISALVSTAKYEIAQ